MNKYGTLAQQMWQQLAPSALAAIEDPNRHFSTLGEEALEQVTSLTIELQGSDLPGETYFQKVGRIENAKLRAEEIVQEELLIPPPEIRDLSEDDLDDLQPSEAQQAIAGMWRLLHADPDEDPESSASPRSSESPGSSEDPGDERSR